MVSVRIDKGRNGKHNVFKACVTHLLPYDHVAKCRSVGTKLGSADISDTTAEVSSFGAKQGIGKSGVYLRL